MRGWALGLALLAAACSDRTTDKPLPAAGTPPAHGTGSAAIPAGAIPAADNLYMVPAGLLDGCPSFRPFSPTGAVVQAIHFRKQGGGFTMSRADADCTAQ